MNGLLPPPFAALEPFAECWAGATAPERAALRDAADRAEAHAFYAAAQPLLAPALAYLDDRSLALLNEQDARLLHLMLTFAHISLAEEVQREDEPLHRHLRPHMRITSAPADNIAA